MPVFAEIPFNFRELSMPLKIEMRHSEEIASILRDLNEASNSPIYFKFESGGGNFWAAKSIVEAMTSSKAPIIGYAPHLLSSMGVVVFQACNRRIISKNSKFGFHELTNQMKYTFFFSLKSHLNREEAYRILDQYIDEIENCQDYIYGILSHASKKSQKELEELIKEKRKLVGKEIIEWGFADEIL